MSIEPEKINSTILSEVENIITSEIRAELEKEIKKDFENTTLEEKIEALAKLKSLKISMNDITENSNDIDFPETKELASKLLRYFNET